VLLLFYPYIPNHFVWYFCSSFCCKLSFYLLTLLTFLNKPTISSRSFFISCYLSSYFIYSFFYFVPYKIYFFYFFQSSVLYIYCYLPDELSSYFFLLNLPVAHFFPSFFLVFLFSGQQYRNRDMGCVDTLKTHTHFPWYWNTQTSKCHRLCKLHVVRVHVMCT